MGICEAANDQVNIPCVLIVDDEPTLRRLMRRALTGLGLQIVEAADGFEALEKFRIHEVVAVVSDVRMPSMNGLELLEHLQGLAPEVPVILVSGSEEVRSRAGAQAIGAFDFLRKPFNLLELGHSVRGALGEARPVPSLSVA